MDSEKKLVNKIIHGNKESFSELVERYQRLVAHIVYSSVRNQDDRDDLCQEIFLKVYVSLSSFKFRSKLSTWIGRISYNTCVNYLKKKNLPIDDNINELAGNGTPFNQIALSDHPADAEIHKEGLTHIIEQNIQKLPKQHQTVLILFHMDNLTYIEISKILDISVSNVKVMLHRARKRLRGYILSEYRKEEI